MEGDRYATLDLSGLKTPCYLIDLAALRRNLEILAGVKRRSGCRILLALKGFAAFSAFSLVREYLDGAAASSLNEARLGKELGGELHVYAPAYRPDEAAELAALADHMVFNSHAQWVRYRDLAASAGVSVGVRVNPEVSTVTPAIYDPCCPGSRLGMTAAAFADRDFSGVEGIHFHAHCEQFLPALRASWEGVQARFGKVLADMRWVNLGGGQRITSPGYDRDGLVALLTRIAEQYAVQVYLEPGQAVAWEAGCLVASVLDIIDGDPPVAILDTSAATHMPDVLEMPYRPQVVGAGAPGERAFTYRLGGMSCLAGDVIGDYAFDARLVPGVQLVFTDMAHYTMVKNTTFNGVGLPAIGVCNTDAGTWKVVRRFGYDDYRGRLS